MPIWKEIKQFFPRRQKGYRQRWKKKNLKTDENI